jgi:hypothetical protein
MEHACRIPDFICTVWGLQVWWKRRTVCWTLRRGMENERKLITLLLFPTVHVDLHGFYSS